MTVLNVWRFAGAGLLKTWVVLVVVTISRHYRFTIKSAKGITLPIFQFCGRIFSLKRNVNVR